MRLVIVDVRYLSAAGTIFCCCDTLAPLLMLRLLLMLCLLLRLSIFQLLPFVPFGPSRLPMVDAMNTYGDLETLVSEDERSVSGGKIAVGGDRCHGRCECR